MVSLKQSNKPDTQLIYNILFNALNKIKKNIIHTQEDISYFRSNKIGKLGRRFLYNTLRNSDLPFSNITISKKYNIEMLLASVKNYIGKSNANRKKVTIEYVLLDHVNDSTDQAHELARLLKDTPCKINLIPFNPFPGSDYGKPSNSRIDRFNKVLMEYENTVTIRKTRGDDIDAACGQLAGDVIDRTKRTLKKRMQGEAISVKMAD